MSRIAGITSNTVPWEILRAAGFAPRLLESVPGPTPYADRYMEPVFDPRYRAIFDRLCSGEWSDLSMVVISRASEQEHKLYLYLREVAREGVTSSIPKLYLYNLLHTRTPESYDYGLERTRQMVRDFGVSDGALVEAIEESNRARAALREIQRKRDDGCLEGSAAMEWISGFYSGSRAEFARDVLARLSRPLPAVIGKRPRVLIKGVSIEDARLHRIVEQAGGYAIAEDDWRGSRAGGTDVRTDIDPVTAVFEKYFYDEVSPRVQPASDRDEWFHTKVTSGVDAVLFYIPLEDDVAGWDYPRQAAWLQERTIPSMVIRSVEPSTELDAFVRGLERH